MRWIVEKPLQLLEPARLYQGKRERIEREAEERPENEHCRRIGGDLPARTGLRSRLRKRAKPRQDVPSSREAGKRPPQGGLVRRGPLLQPLGVSRPDQSVWLSADGSQERRADVHRRMRLGGRREPGAQPIRRR